MALISRAGRARRRQRVSWARAASAVGAHPNVKLDVVTYDGDANGSNTLQTKVDLYDHAGSGWPDVVFTAVNSEVSRAQPAGFTAPLSKGLISNSVLSQFSAGALAPCTLNGTVYCLRNDLAPMADSDWPVCLLAAGYVTVQATLDPALSQLAAAGPAAVLGGSAAHWYRTSA